jgi:hypothetical protein
MGEVRVLPTVGGVFADIRNQARALRVSWHTEAGLVVLSLWDGGRCTGTARIAAADVPELIHALALPLAPEQLGLVPEPAHAPDPPEPE